MVDWCLVVYRSRDKYLIHIRVITKLPNSEQSYKGTNNLTKGRERNSLTYKYYIEIQTVRIFTWQFSIERVSISATVESTMQGLSTENWKLSPVSSLYQYIVGLHDKIYLYKDVLIFQAFLNMMVAILKCMSIYNQIMILDHKSFRKCVCDFAATLTRSNINLEFVYLCIRSKDFAPISSISYYIHWAALAVWFFVFFITSMKLGMFEVLLHTYFIFSNI